MNKEEYIEFLEWYRVAQKVVIDINSKDPDKVVDMYLNSDKKAIY